MALITGASRGLGETLASFLAKQGFRLIITARGELDLRSAAERLRLVGGDVVAISGDVTDPHHRRRLVEAAQDWSRIDVLVNNASELGKGGLVRLVDATPDAIRSVFEVNVDAPLALSREALPLLRRANGLVVNISSDAALGGYPGWGVYGASKAALDLVTKTLAAELRDGGVAVVSVDPGDMRTKMHQDAYPGEDISDRPLPDATLPFWAWLLSQEPAKVSGERFQAQGSLWEVPG